MALAPQEVGQRIRKRRVELGWTHQRLADEIGVGLRTAQRWQTGLDKKGKSTLPRLATLMDLADKMDVERSYFVEDATSYREREMASFRREIAEVRALVAAIALKQGVDVPPAQSGD